MGGNQVSGFGLGIGASTVAARYHDWEVGFRCLAVTDSVWIDFSVS